MIIIHCHLSLHLNLPAIANNPGPLLLAIFISPALSFFDAIYIIPGAFDAAIFIISGLFLAKSIIFGAFC